MRNRIPLMAGAALAAGIQTVALGAMIESRASILRSGREVVLKTEPVDPRDLLRGDFVRLGYEISRVSLERFGNDGPAADETGETIHVALKPGADGAFAVSRASMQPIETAADEIVLAGKVDGISDQWVGVSYGIERYYVPEGEGRPIEDAQGARKVDIVLAVDQAGHAQIKALKLDGKQLYREPLY